MSEHISAAAPTSGRGTGDRTHERRYSVEVLATLSGVGAATIRRYERYGLVEPTRASGGPTWYTDRDLERVRRIRRLSNDLGVNLAAVEVILHMRERMLAMHDELIALRRRIGLE
jgi:MerR family transcriptional regulator/heat shock protein HspR